MNELIRFFQRNPILLLILVAWIVSAISSARQAVAKAKAEAEKRAGGARPTPGSAPSASNQRPAPTTHREARSPEEIAEAIRRAMGVETKQRQAPPSGPTMRAAPRGPTRVEPQPQAQMEAQARRQLQPESPSRPPPQPQPQAQPQAPRVRRRVDYDEIPQRPVRGDQPQAQRRTLADEMLEKARRADEEHLGALADRVTDLGGAVRERKLALHVGGVDRRARRRRPIERILDLSRPATAFIASEVFGRPLALREEWGNAPTDP